MRSFRSDDTTETTRALFSETPSQRFAIASARIASRRKAFERPSRPKSSFFDKVEARTLSLERTLGTGIGECVRVLAFPWSHGFRVLMKQLFSFSAPTAEAATAASEDSDPPAFSGELAAEESGVEVNDRLAALRFLCLRGGCLESSASKVRKPQDISATPHRHILNVWNIPAGPIPESQVGRAPPLGV